MEKNKKTTGMHPSKSPEKNDPTRITKKNDPRKNDPTPDRENVPEPTAKQQGSSKSKTSGTKGEPYKRNLKK